MSTYKGKPIVVNRPISEIYARFNDLSLLQEKIDKLPKEQLAQVGEISIEPDSITLTNPQIGALRFEIQKRVEPTQVVFGAAQSPIPLTLTLDLKELTPDSTESSASIDVELPMMLRPLIGGKLQEAADKFGELLASLNA